jgi:carbonic anhydrase
VHIWRHFNPNVFLPEVEETAFIHPFAIVIGDCHVEKLVLVAEIAVCRGDERPPIEVIPSMHLLQ